MALPLIIEIAKKLTETDVPAVAENADTQFGWRLVIYDRYENIDGNVYLDFVVAHTRGTQSFEDDVPMFKGKAAAHVLEPFARNFHAGRFLEPATTGLTAVPADFWKTDGPELQNPPAARPAGRPPRDGQASPAQPASGPPAEARVRIPAETPRNSETPESRVTDPRPARRRGPPQPPPEVEDPLHPLAYVGHAIGHQVDEARKVTDKLRADLEDYVLDDGSLGSVLLATYAENGLDVLDGVMEMGGALVDWTRLGEGVRKGGVQGAADDLFRVASLLGAAGMAGKAAATGTVAAAGPSLATTTRPAVQSSGPHARASLRGGAAGGARGGANAGAPARDLPQHGPWPRPHGPVERLRQYGPVQRPQGPVFQGRVVADDAGRLAAKTGRSSKQRLPQTIAEAEAAGLTSGTGSGTVDVAAAKYGHADVVRDALGVSGRDFEAAHISADAFLKTVPGYTKGGGLAMQLPKPVHTSLDSLWKAEAQQLRRLGQTDIAVQDIQRLLDRSIEQAQGLSVAEKGTLSWMVQLDLYSVHGLRPTQRLALPYPNIGAL